MSARAISEASGKRLLNQHLGAASGAAQCRYASFFEGDDWNKIETENPWLKTEKLVVKPDQLIKRRGKLGLIKVNTDFDTVKTWVAEKMADDQKIGKATGKLRKFIVEPFLPHSQEEEAYVCIYSTRDKDVILFHHEGGVDIGDVDSKALKLEVNVEENMVVSADDVKSKLLTEFKGDKDLVARYE
jgi:ATP citrate (pro-S)-lyase